jgi:hypothetical protein
MKTNALLALLLAAPAAALFAPDQPGVDGAAVMERYAKGRTPELYELQGDWNLIAVVASNSAVLERKHPEKLSIHKDGETLKASDGRVGVKVRGRLTLGGFECRMDDRFRLICARYVPAGIHLEPNGGFRPADRHHLLFVYRRPWQFD